MMFILSLILLLARRSNNAGAAGWIILGLIALAIIWYNIKSKIEENKYEAQKKAQNENTEKPKESVRQYHPTNYIRSSNPTSRVTTIRSANSSQIIIPNRNNRRLSPNAGQIWNNRDQERLREMVRSGCSISQIAVELGRTDGAIRARINRLGLENLNVSEQITNNYNFELFHFTAPENLASIRQYGLLSWQELERRNISHIPASSTLSRNLDSRVGLEDYVRLSKSQNHPMFEAAIYYGRIRRLVWLKINPNVIDLPSTLFSDDNATSNRATINNDKNTALNSTSPQAEILVKTRIDPAKIIFPENIN